MGQCVGPSSREKIKGLQVTFPIWHIFAVLHHSSSERLGLVHSLFYLGFYLYMMKGRQKVNQDLHQRGARRLPPGESQGWGNEIEDTQYERGFSFFSKAFIAQTPSRPQTPTEKNRRIISSWKKTLKSSSSNCKPNTAKTTSKPCL